MCDHWMPSLTLPLTWEQYQQLPRHAAYRYEYLEGKAYLTPRTRHYHALLPLAPIETTSLATLRPALENDFEELAPLFASCFHRIQPYGSLDDGMRLVAAREALERTRTGGDGPWMPGASFIALNDGRACGAILVTLLPPGDLCDWSSYHWTTPPPADAVERRLGRPHLTWVFVAPMQAGQGTGTTLLAAAVHALRTMGFTELVTTFMIGNDSSMLWHWRNGFQLLTYPGSGRRRSRG